MSNMAHSAPIHSGAGEMVATRNIGAADLLAARMFLANYQVNGELSQDGMASLLGCRNNNTYSKWERQDQTPTTMVFRAVELVILNTLWMTGKYSPANPPSLAPFWAFREAMSETGFVRMRTPNRDRDVVNLYKSCYQFFSECDGVVRDGYHLRIEGKTFTLRPAFNINGKPRTYHIKNIETILARVARQIKYAGQDVSGNAATLLLDHYREHGYNNEDIVSTRFFFAKRTGDDLEFSIPSVPLLAALQGFLDETCVYIENEENGFASAPDDLLKLRLARLIGKVEGGVRGGDGDVLLSSNDFILRHGFSGNYRLKRHDINLIEKSLCRLTGTDPESIPTPATQLVLASTSAPATVIRGDDNRMKCLWRAQTHFMAVSIVGKALHFTLNDEKHVALINEYIRGVDPTAGKDEDEDE